MRKDRNAEAIRIEKKKTKYKKTRERIGEEVIKKNTTKGGKIEKLKGSHRIASNAKEKQT